MSAYDLYMRKLRSNGSAIAQKASQSNEDDRTIDVQTDEVLSTDQEMQFQFGDDDTQFENLLATTKQNKLYGRSGFVHQSTVSTGVSAGTLNRFLRQASHVSLTIFYYL